MHKLIQGALFAAIGVLILSSLLIPVVNDAQAETRTVSLNTNATYTMSEGGTVAFTLDKLADSSIVTVNGENIENHTGILLSADNFDIRAQEDGQLMLTDLANNVWQQELGSYEIHLTVEGRTATYERIAGGVTTTYTLELSGTIVYYDVNGSYGGFYGTRTINVTPDTSVYAVFFPVYGGSTWSAFGVLKLNDGEVEETITAPVRYYNNTFNEVDTPVYTITANYNQAGDYWTYQGISITAAEFGTRYGEIIAPLEYLEITETDNAVISVIGLMPFILIFALIMGVLGYAVYQRIE